MHIVHNKWLIRGYLPSFTIPSDLLNTDAAKRGCVSYAWSASPSFDVPSVPWLRFNTGVHSVHPPDSVVLTHFSYLTMGRPGKCLILHQ